MTFFILMLWLLVGQPEAGSARRFHEVPFDRFPESILERDVCPDHEDRAECLNTVRESGAVWAGDVNGDGIEELLFHGGVEWTGSGGLWFTLYQKQGDDWQSIAEVDGEDGSVGWFTDRPRFEILPVSHGGYHDLRVKVDLCLKWTGRNYVPYEPEDCRALSPSWFDTTNMHEAEILWHIRYSGFHSIKVDPLWFPVSDAQLNEFPGRKIGLQPWPKYGDLPHQVRSSLRDPGQNVRWVSLSRAGVWGIRGKQGFLLVPRTSYLGICTLKIKGDWLLGFESCGAENDSEADLRYNRQTHELLWSSEDF